jgi:hypothetical protein
MAWIHTSLFAAILYHVKLTAFFRTCGAELSDDEIDIAEADFEDWVLGPSQHLVDYTKTFSFNVCIEDTMKYWQLIPVF